MIDLTQDKRTAYRIETDRLVLRCWSPADAPMLRTVLDECDAYLRPFIPFMKDEPRSLEQTVQWLRGHRAAFDQDQMHRYAVFDQQEQNLLGENMLLSRVGPGALEIGYWTHKDAAGQGYATETTCAMVRIAFEIEKVRRVEIVCTPQNAASAAIPAKLGFTHEATLKERAHDTDGEIRDLMIWTLFKDDYPASIAAKQTIRAYDCLGRSIK